MIPGSRGTTRKKARLSFDIPNITPAKIIIGTLEEEWAVIVLARAN
jgi:hypothetical protein